MLPDKTGFRKNDKTGFEKQDIKWYTDQKYRFAKSNLWRRRRNDAQILTPCAWIILCRFLQSILIQNRGKRKK